jgi:alpha-methylacyl-CoA racemase
VPGSPGPPAQDLLVRHKSSIALDLKSPGGLSLLKSLLRNADVLLDPYRPGVLEALGLNPSELLANNKRLIIARLTGFRRDGKYSKMAGHDVNYLAVSGILSQLGRSGAPPYPPANILADFAGGGLMCAFGIILALLVREKSGKGQVVESNMVDGSAYLGTFMRLAGKAMWDRPRGENLLDGGSPFYDVYECKDKGYMAVGALEPQFFGKLLKGLGLDKSFAPRQHDRSTWPAMRVIFRTRLLQKTRKEWERIFDGQDACCTPVLSQSELEEAGYDQRPAVGLSDTPALPTDPVEAWKSSALVPGTGGESILESWLGWKRDRHFAEQGGALVQMDTAKL